MRELPPDVAAWTSHDPSSMLEVLGQARSIRHLRSDAVAPVLLETLVWGATRASSPNNTQHWHFVVITEPDRRRAVRTALEPFERWLEQIPAPTTASETRTREGARHLLDHLADAPALIVVCAENAYPPLRPSRSYMWSIVGGASQNLIVTARSLGLAATLTMFHVADERAVARCLDLPDDVHIGSIIPVGWPARPFGPVARKPLEEVLHRERW